MTDELSVLFVCMGNICRSPLAEGALRALVEAQRTPMPVKIDSAGTHDYHVGNPPDSRARSAALRRGFDIGTLRARRVVRADFARFDLVVAMDRDNWRELESLCPDEHRPRLRLFMDYAGGEPSDVPDPYYGDENAFELALDLIQRGAQGVLAELRDRRG